MPVIKEMTPLERLQLARKRLTNPANWLRGKFTDGRDKFCLLAACSPNPDGLYVGNEIAETLHVVLLDLYNHRGTISWFNDGVAAHPDILRVLDEAIKRLS